MSITDLACCHSILHCLEVVVKSAVKTYLILHRILLKRIDHFLDLSHVMIDRLLAEYVLSCIDRLHRDRRMRICGRTDQHRVNLWICDDLLVILRCILHTHLLRPCGRLVIHKWICKAFDPRIAHLRANTLNMNSSDSSCSDNTYCNHNLLFSFQIIRKRIL